MRRAALALILGLAVGSGQAQAFEFSQSARAAMSIINDLLLQGGILDAGPQTFYGYLPSPTAPHYSHGPTDPINGQPGLCDIVAKDGTTCLTYQSIGGINGWKCSEKRGLSRELQGSRAPLATCLGSFSTPYYEANGAYFNGEHFNIGQSPDPRGTAACPYINSKWTDGSAYKCIGTNTYGNLSSTGADAIVAQCHELLDGTPAASWCGKSQQ